MLMPSLSGMLSRVENPPLLVASDMETLIVASFGRQSYSLSLNHCSGSSAATGCFLDVPNDIS